jgi:hypothetical protein
VGFVAFGFSQEDLMEESVLKIICFLNSSSSILGSISTPSSSSQTHSMFLFRNLLPEPLSLHRQILTLLTLHIMRRPLTILKLLLRKFLHLLFQHHHQHAAHATASQAHSRPAPHGYHHHNMAELLFYSQIVESRPFDEVYAELLSLL